MKLFILLFSISILSLPLLAQRILVTKTAHKSNLKSINTKLKSLHIKMYVQRFHEYYFIYTKEYPTQTETEAKLRKIQTIFLHAKLGEETKKNQEVKHKRNTSLALKKDKNWIVGVGIGNSSISGNISGNASFKDSGMSYSFKVGYFMKPYFLSTLSYSTTSVEKTTLSNTYLTVSYYYDITQNSDIYIGALLGYSSLKMDFANSVPSGSAIYGAQVGVSYDLFGYIPLSLTYKGMLLSHIISFTSETQTVDIHTNLQNTIELGIAYKF